MKSSLKATESRKYKKNVVSEARMLQASSSNFSKRDGEGYASVYALCRRWLKAKDSGSVRRERERERERGVGTVEALEV